MKFFLLILCILCINTAFAETTFTARAPESQNDTRQSYTYQLLELALQETIGTHGAFKIELAPAGTNMKRATRDVEQGIYENYFLRQSVSQEIMTKLEAVPFPVDLGIVSYRVAFTSNDTKKRLGSVSTLEDLKKFNIVQGIGWLDTKILSANGFSIDTSGSYESMFTMVARNRADLFTRGANELLNEWLAHQEIDNLTFDESFALYYPLPRFFFTTKGNRQAANRVQSGLINAYKKGLVMKLWQKEYGPSIKFAKLGKRKIFHIENPLIKGIDTSYTKYLYNPFTD